jgi:hypothetical protein
MTPSYSNILNQFVSPLIQSGDTIEIYQSKISFGAAIWNAVIMRDIDEKHFSKAKEELLKIHDNKKEMEELIDFMVKRKAELFSEYKELIKDTQLKINQNKGFDLTVETATVQIHTFEKP